MHLTEGERQALKRFVASGSKPARPIEMDSRLEAQSALIACAQAPAGAAR